MSHPEFGVPSHESERSPTYHQTAAYIVDALGALVMATHADAIKDVLAASSNGWTPTPPIPNLALGIIRTSPGRTESVHHGPTAMGPDAASYFSATRASHYQQTISEIRVGHFGDIETRDYVYPPVGGSLDDQPPFEPIADDPDALSLMRDRVDMIR